MANENNKTREQLSWVKGLLNNLPLLKWVKKYSADRILPDNKIAEGFGIRITPDSISIGDTGMAKMLVTGATFAGEEHTRFNAKHLFETLKEIGNEAVLIVTKGNDKTGAELVLQYNDSVVVLASMPKTDGSGRYG